MIVGVLVLSLACGLSAGAAASAAGAPLWIALLAMIVMGNVSVAAIAFLRLATGAQGDDPWRARDDAFEAGLPSPVRSIG